MVPNTVPLLRRPKKQNPKPERMSIRSTNSTIQSNLDSSHSHPSTAIPPSPNNTTVRTEFNKSRDGTDVTTQDISRINPTESTILPKPPTNSPTKSPPLQNLHSLEPKGPAPFFPTNRKVFNNQASLYAQLFSSPPSSSREHFTLNDFQKLAKSKSNIPASISTVIKSTQNYKKLTSWLEAFPPSQTNLNTLKLEGQLFYVTNSLLPLLLQFLLL